MRKRKRLTGLSTSGPDLPNPTSDISPGKCEPTPLPPLLIPWPSLGPGVSSDPLPPLLHRSCWILGSSWKPGVLDHPRPPPESCGLGSPAPQHPSSFLTGGEWVWLVWAPHIQRPPLLANSHTSIASQAMPPLPATPPENPSVAAPNLQKEAQTPWPGIQGPSWSGPCSPFTQDPERLPRSGPGRRGPYLGCCR